MQGHFSSFWMDGKIMKSAKEKGTFLLQSEGIGVLKIFSTLTDPGLLIPGTEY